MGVLDGKSVVVTGSGRGLGSAYARFAASEGAQVVVNDADGGEAAHVVEEIRAAGGKAVADDHSVSEWDGAAALVERCVSEFGRIDGLVNNAGVHFTRDPLDDDEDGFRRTIEVNLLGTLYCGLHAIRRMVPQGGGVIVNITSGAHLGMNGRAAYAASKGGVASVTYTWALDLADRNVRVNAVSPIAYTRMAQAEGPRPGVPRWSPDRTGPLVTFLLSDLSRGITGQVVRLQGRQLSLLRHPAFVAPVLERDEWSLADINAAFEQTFRKELKPVGNGAQEYAYDSIGRAGYRPPS